MNIAGVSALLTRSLREDNRLKRTYFARCGLVFFILSVLFLNSSSFRYSGAPGLEFFQYVVYTNFGFISIMGLSYFAGAVAEEKEEETLGLLRMTNIGPLSILLGKSTSRLFSVALLLGVQVPFTLLAVTLGGVSVRQVLAAYATLGAYIFLLCNVALLFSVMFTRVGIATVVTGVVMILFFALPFWGVWLINELARIGYFNPSAGLAQGTIWTLQKLQGANPVLQLWEILRNGFSDPPVGYQVWSCLVLGAAFFALAWVTFDFFTRDRREGAVTRSLGLWRLARLWRWGAGRPWPSTAAVVWKDYFSANGGWAGALMRCLCYGGLVWFILYMTPMTQVQGRLARRWEEFGWVVFWCAMCCGLGELAVGASRILRMEIQAKTLSSLAALPMPVWTMFYRKVYAMCLSIAPVTLLAAAGFVIALTHNDDPYRFLQNSDDALLVCFIGFTQVALGWHLTVYLSLWLKRLALPAALVAMGIGNMVISGIFFATFHSGGEAAWVVYHLGVLVVAGIVHFKIFARLERLTAEET